MSSPQISDPQVPNWDEIALPDTWADTINLRSPVGVVKFLRRVFTKKRGMVQPEPDLYGRESIPKYVLQEFHNLPNGNYSRRFSLGYINGFDQVMLGEMTKTRDFIANTVKGCGSVLDAGCGGGKGAAIIHAADNADTWGLDPSPYLLKHAAKSYPEVNFVHGVIEQSQFSSERFDAISGCFLFHEMPPRYIKQALAESYRMLKPGGLMVICEPSELQVRLSYWQILRRYGFKACYFKRLAGSVNEPFLKAWHQFAQIEKLCAPGFELCSDEDNVPIRRIVLRKPF